MAIAVGGLPYLKNSSENIKRKEIRRAKTDNEASSRNQSRHLNEGLPSPPRSPARERQAATDLVKRGGSRRRRSKLRVLRHHCVTHNSNARRNLQHRRRHVARRIVENEHRATAHQTPESRRPQTSNERQYHEPPRMAARERYHHQLKP